MESGTLLDRVITSHALGCRGQIEARNKVGRGRALPSADLIHKYALLYGKFEYSRQITYQIENKERNSKMKNTLWANHLNKHTVSILNKSGFYTNEDFNRIPVLGLLLMTGIDRQDVDELLKALFFEENTWRLGIVDILSSATEKEGKQYVKDIFEAYSFDEHPEWFYGMTVRELLDLEFIEERLIPFITSLMQYFLENQEEDITSYFVDRTDIEENFEAVYENIGVPAGSGYKWYDPYDENDDDEFEYPED